MPMLGPLQLLKNALAIQIPSAPISPFQLTELGKELPSPLLAGNVFFLIVHLDILEHTSSKQYFHSSEGVYPVAEVDPTGQYWPYDELLESGSKKKVYRALDSVECFEVAWNKVVNVPLSSDLKELQVLRHENIIHLYSVWKDEKNDTMNLIKEGRCSTSLKDFIQEHKHVSEKALKNWSRQILKGLNCLHTNERCFVHGGLSCRNVFIPDDGKLAIMVIVGDVELGYVAPKVESKNHPSAIDIYCFGICLLEIATLEFPYSEVKSVQDVEKHLEMLMGKLKGKETLVAIIERCLAQPKDRPSAADLFADPYFFC